jgi:quercetin dioxygenase-like cupin family protein
MEVEMKTVQLLKGLEFHDNNPYAEPLHVDKNGRALRFTLRPGQSVREHNAPQSPVYIVVLKGQGAFAGGNGEEKPLGPNSLVIFEPGENHSIRAQAEELVFIAILHGASSWQ